MHDLGIGIGFLGAYVHDLAMGAIYLVRCPPARRPCCLRNVIHIQKQLCKASCEHCQKL